MSKTRTLDQKDDGLRPCDMDDDRYTLVENADTIVESIGEKFIEERFAASCPLPGFESARLERFTRTRFPRILVEFDCFDTSSLSVSSLKADLKRLGSIASDNPEKLAQLLDNLDDPDGFRDLACDLGLSEEAFIEAGGGLIGWIIVIAAAVVLTGCGDPRCGVRHKLDSAPCRLKQGHSGKHRDNPGHRW
ncbi:hypothetical protein KX928_07270 [Roseobacter sp. YSTF-M11]|uniref:Uncharacterized protein n=1 Tax=Roseobacter insulae TaxID=2859783 RepID=A0A9X1FTW6_9RHOB|nr:hypothetical protein [Roseobacter insulae]MBW4707583.1 hypothetical protein [Roseobacter insulae]